MATPGHTSEDLSVLVSTSDGVVAIVGDLFENADDQVGDAWTRFSRDPLEQRRHRAAILSRADFIVPGHGDRFATRRRPL
jgi:glyoxylase-like metal-dependent hydrolase (beta-lactamase superfamily II)